MYSGDLCKVTRAAGAILIRIFTPPHHPVHSDFFKAMHALHERHLASRPQPASRATRAAQTGDAAARTPAVAPTRPPPPWPWRRPWALIAAAVALLPAGIAARVPAEAA